MVDRRVQIRTHYPVGASPTGAKDSSPVAWEASWRESKTAEPSDSMLRKEYMQHIRLQRAVNADVASSHANPVAETVDNVRKQQGLSETSPIRQLSPAGYQRRHDVKDDVETGEALGARRRNPVEEMTAITVSGKCGHRRQGGGSGRITEDGCAAKRTRREGPGPASHPYDKAKKTAQGTHEAVNYHRFADDIVITVSGHHTKRGWAERALQRLREQLAPLGVELNQEKTKVVNTLDGEAFGFLGFDLRRVRKRKGNGYYLQMTPKKKARQAIKAKIRDTIRHAGTTPIGRVIAKLNAALAGWVNYFRVGNSSRAFSEVRDYLEMKVRTLLTRRKRRRKTSVGWRRWSNAYLYEVLKLYWDWKIHPLPGVGQMA